MDTQASFWDVLEQRRSIRKFKADPIPGEIIQRILEAGVGAPNARNMQSWRFAVITDAEVMDQLADGLNENFRKDMLATGKTAAEVDQMLVERKARLCGAPLIVMIFVDVSVLGSYTPDNPASPEYLMAVQSAALAGGHMLLAGQALGLGGLWMGGPLHAQPQVQRVLQPPETWLSQGMLLFGYPDEAPEKKPRVPMDQVVKYFP